jgi:hypothetical protein
MQRADRRTLGLVLVATCALAVGHCGGGGGATGGGPTVPTVPPAPTPTPGPTPDPPISQSCAKLPPGNPNAGCQVEASEYQDAVDAAIRTLQGEKPAIFDGDQVLSVGAYYVGLIKVLDRQGLCAVNDGEELGVTNRASSNEQFHVLTSQNRARFGPQSYRTTSSPSAVPIPLGPLPPPPAGCSLPSSREVACGRESEGRYINDVSAAIDQVMKEKPELFDYNDLAPVTGWPAVKNLEAYQQAIVDSLVKKSYCAKSDGEEIAVKLGSNTLSEQYDVNYQDKYVRMGNGIYRATCYPAAF